MSTQVQGTPSTRAGELWAYGVEELRFALPSGCHLRPKELQQRLLPLLDPRSAPEAALPCRLHVAALHVCVATTQPSAALAPVLLTLAHGWADSVGTSGTPGSDAGASAARAFPANCFLDRHRDRQVAAFSPLRLFLSRRHTRWAPVASE